MFSAACAMLCLVQNHQECNLLLPERPHNDNPVNPLLKLSQLLGCFFPIFVKENKGKCYGQLGSNEDYIIAADDKRY